MKERMRVLLPLIACVFALTGAMKYTQKAEQSYDGFFISKSCEWILEDAKKAVLNPFGADYSAAEIADMSSKKQTVSDVAENKDLIAGNRFVAMEISEEEGIEPDEIQLFDLKSKTYNFEYLGKAFSVTEEQFDMLCRIAESEAGTEDIRGKELVINVVLNRVVSEYFPNTIEGVILEKGAFSPVSGGSFYTVQYPESTVEAVINVFNEGDFSNYSLYFMQRNAARKWAARWFDENLKFLFKHGCHEFFTEFEAR